jgi:tRNA A-37 threonylcarbamoyl transferase component Bud32
MLGDVRVGPYRIIRLVNRGGQGSVYLGYDKRLQRRVAIKVYPLPVQRNSRKQLLKEARVVASMDSPRIVQIYDVIESQDHLAMVMEYVPGCDLEEFLVAVRPSLASILVVAGDLAAALSIARQQQIVHGDLKASNVLIADDGRVKLTDFGIARRSAAAESGSSSALTPEHCLGHALDERSDLFALGCLLYRMLTGVHPFFREGQLDLQLLLEKPPQALRTRVAPDLGLAPELVALVDRLLQKNPRDRPANPRIVRQALRQVSRTIPLAASNSLLSEARPCFRPESADDMPPAIPAALAREGRSVLPFKAGSGNWFRGQRLWRGAVAALLAVVLAGAGYLAARAPSETAIHIAAPVLRLGAQAAIPEDISSRWLVQQVAAAVSEQLGPLRISGPIGATPVTTISSDTARGEQPAPAERVELGLRCMELLCVFAMTRFSGEQQTNGQAVLFPDMSPAQWREIVRATAGGLYH